MSMPGTETIRFRRPTNKQPKFYTKDGEEVLPPSADPSTPGGGEVDKFGGKHGMDVNKWKKRHQGLLQDQTGRQKNGPFTPSFSLAVRLLLLVRVSGAMYSNIQDCDEVFNFFEPLHYLTHNSGFQTWELSPEFAVRSWSYLILHWPLAELPGWIMKMDKRASFFTLRIGLGIISTIAEAKFYRAVVDHINERVGRYLLFAGLLGSAGMWGASTAFLPSSFTLTTTLLAWSYALRPAQCNSTGDKDVLKATFWFAVGAVLGWPFSALLGIPFVVEQVWLRGDDVVGGSQVWRWRADRWGRLAKAVGLCSLLVIPVLLVDSWAYGRLTLPNLNIVLYNIFSSKGPNLFGTDPWYFYFLNLFINFNFLLPLALLSLPALLITYLFDYRRLGKSQMRPKEGEGSPYSLVVLRLSGFYIWLIVLSLQPHKEERFMFPAYGLLGMNAAVTIFLVKGWVETFYVKVTSSSYRAGRSRIFSNIALAMVVIPVTISVSRMFALAYYYHSPMSVVYSFQYTEIPKVLTAMGYKAVPPPKGYEQYEGTTINPEWDFSVLKSIDPPLRLCWGKEWYRFPSSYLVPQGIDIQLIGTGDDFMVPRKWQPSLGMKESYWPRQETRVVREGKFNDENRQPSDVENVYVEPSTCNYLIDLTLPSHQPNSAQPDFANLPEQWERLYCAPFLDSASSAWWTRVFWLPVKKAEEGRVWGEYCLLKQK